MPKLLLIDDHEMVLDALTWVLEHEGFDVLTCTNGECGIRTALNQRPDVIITDYNMPEMSGLDVLRAVRGDPQISKIPVVVITLEESRSVREAFFNHGADAFVTKSMCGSVLINTINSLIRRETNAEARLNQAMA